MSDIKEIFLPKSIFASREKGPTRFASPPVCKLAEPRFLIAVDNRLYTPRDLHMISLVGGKTESGIVKRSSADEEMATGLCLTGPFAGYICADLSDGEQQRLISQNFNATPFGRGFMPIRPFFLKPEMPVRPGYNLTDAEYKAFARATRGMDTSRGTWSIDRVLSLLRLQGLPADWDRINMNLLRFDDLIKANPQFAPGQVTAHLPELDLEEID